MREAAPHSGGFIVKRVFTKYAITFLGGKFETCISKVEADCHGSMLEIFLELLERRVEASSDPDLFQKSVITFGSTSTFTCIAKSSTLTRESKIVLRALIVNFLYF